jgi:hypothetical protein
VNQFIEVYVFKLDSEDKVRNPDGSLMSLDEIAADLMQIDFDEDNIRFVVAFFETDTGVFDVTCWVMFEILLQTRYGVLPENAHAAVLHFIHAMRAKFPQYV